MRPVLTASVNSPLAVGPEDIPRMTSRRTKLLAIVFVAVVVGVAVLAYLYTQTTLLHPAATPTLP